MNHYISEITGHRSGIKWTVTSML